MGYIPVDVGASLKRECKRRRYSDRTAETYLFCVNKFLKWCGKELGKISKRDVKEFLFHLSDKGLSGSSLNTYHMAIRFLFESVLDKKMWIDIKYSKVPVKMQRVLSKEEVWKLLGKIENWKHRLMIELMYSAGLRVSEVVNLKVRDLALDKGFGFVRNGKGRKDRIFVLARVVKEKLGNLIEIEKLTSESYVFVSNRGEKYNIRSLQEIVKRASKKAGLGGVHPHTLRHSFATHLIENDYSLTDVQASLGHKSPETSMIYVHMASPKIMGIKSPFEKK